MNHSWAVRCDDSADVDESHLGDRVTRREKGAVHAFTKVFPVRNAPSLFSRANDVTSFFMRPAVQHVGDKDEHLLSMSSYWASAHAAG